MLVHELIEELQRMNPKAEVKFAYGYGDYWRTTVAADIKTVDEGFVKHSAYHNMDKVIHEDDRNEESSEERLVVLLSAE